MRVTVVCAIRNIGDDVRLKPIREASYAAIPVVCRAVFPNGGKCG